MTTMIRKLTLRFAAALACLWRLVPGRIRELIVTGMFVLESRGCDPATALRRLFLLRDRLDWITNERAMAYGGGIHPKHRLTRYHDFFVNRIAARSRVLDIGCGYGAVARSIAARVPDSEVVGIEKDHEKFMQAQAGTGPANLTFVEGDARRKLPSGHWDVLVLSNILEHIEDRVTFLKEVVANAKPKTVLIRVPLFERDWQLPLRKELRVNYFSDPDHKTEPALDEFKHEIEAAEMTLGEIVTLWGEIWAECRCRQ